MLIYYIQKEEINMKGIITKICVKNDYPDPDPDPDRGCFISQKNE